MKMLRGSASATSSVSIKAICRGFGWLLCVTIAILTYVPPSFRPVTPAPHFLEHLAIFIMTGVAFGVGYPNRQLVYAIAFVIFAAVLEIGQIWDPGRHARFDDFAFNVLGAWLGLFVTFVWTGLIVARSGRRLIR